MAAQFSYEIEIGAMNRIAALNTFDGRIAGGKFGKSLSSPFPFPGQNEFQGFKVDVGIERLGGDR